MRIMRALALTAAAGLAYAHLETKCFTLHRETVPVLPPGSSPLTVLHFTDLHTTAGQGRKLAWLRTLADLEPDLVVSTGDNIASDRAIAPLLDALGGLLARPGAFVFGSNDYYAPTPKNPARYLRADSRSALDAHRLDTERLDTERLDTERLRAALVEAGWLDLNNRRGTLTLPGGRVLDLVGTDDAHLDRDRLPAPRPPVSDPTVSAPAAAPLLRLGVTHAPYQRVLGALQHDGVDLILAGHTHGGQLCVPGIGALVTNCDLDRRRASGLSGWPGARPNAPHGRGTDSVWLHVSGGAGTSPYAPVRFACRPAATLLTLVASDWAAGGSFAG